MDTTAAREYNIKRVVEHRRGEREWGHPRRVQQLFFRDPIMMPRSFFLPL